MRDLPAEIDPSPASNEFLLTRTTLSHGEGKGEVQRQLIVQRRARILLRRRRRLGRLQQHRASQDVESQESDRDRSEQHIVAYDGKPLGKSVLPGPFINQHVMTSDLRFQISSRGLGGQRENPARRGCSAIARLDRMNRRPALEAGIDLSFRFA
jgi:hypothetical protein